MFFLVVIVFFVYVLINVGLILDYVVIDCVFLFFVGVVMIVGVLILFV